MPCVTDVRYDSSSAFSDIYLTTAQVCHASNKMAIGPHTFCIVQLLLNLLLQWLHTVLLTPEPVHVCHQHFCSALCSKSGVCDGMHAPLQCKKCICELLLHAWTKQAEGETLVLQVLILAKHPDCAAAHACSSRRRATPRWVTPPPHISLLWICRPVSPSSSGVRSHARWSCDRHLCPSSSSSPNNRL